MPGSPLKVFISYSHKDEDLKEELEVHLASLKREGAIAPWQDRDIEAGKEWDETIRQELEAAQIILLLITPRFLASRYCFDEETQRAMARHAEGTARVVPIIMKPSDWQSSPFSKLQVLPKDGKPVTLWDNQDEALVSVVTQLRRVVKTMANATPQVEAHRTADGHQERPELTLPDGLPKPPKPPAKRTAANPYQKRMELFSLLSSLPGPQFEQIVFTLRPPAGNVPPPPAPLGQRVAALLEWAESPIGCSLEALETVVNAVLQR